MNCTDIIAIVSAVIDFLGIIVAAWVAVWIVNTIQKKIDNLRSIKDHLINEIVDIRRLYREMIEKTINGEYRPRDVKRQLRLLSARVTDLIRLANAQFNNCVNRDFLLPYQLDLSIMITYDENFENAFRNNDLFSLNAISQNDLARFLAEKDHLFNELIVIINKAK